MPLKLLVTVKRVEDPESKIRPTPDGTGIVTDGVSYKMNPFDEIAVEEALRLKEAHGGEVVVASIGGDKAASELRAALAMGADRGVLVRHEGALDPGQSQAILERLVAEERPDLVVMGKQAIDDDQNQTGPDARRAPLLAAGDVRVEEGEPRERGRAEEAARPRGLGATGRGSRSCARWTAESRRSMSRCPPSSRSICGSTSRGSRRCPAS